MIGRSDGGNAGGVLPLTDEMQQHGARPTWLGYVGVDDVDATVAAIEQAGGKALMPAFDIPGIGRIAMVADPQGAPFYVMKPIPPEGHEDEVSDVFSPDRQQRVRWNELATTDPAAPALLRPTSSAGPATSHADGRDGRISLHPDHGGMTHRRGHAGAMPRRPALALLYPACRRSTARSRRSKAGGGTVSMGPMEVPGGDISIIGERPAGREFALVGPRK